MDLKIQPNAVEFEDIVLGACMLDRDILPVVATILKPDSFYNDKHKVIFEAIMALAIRHNPVDIMTVTQELKRMDKLDWVGGAYFVTGLTNRVSSGANTEYHARIILEKYIAREYIRICYQKAALAYEESTDIFDLMDSTERELKALRPESNILQTTIQAFNEMYDDSQKAAANKGQTGLYCHLQLLNNILDGFVPGLYIVGARPSIGKSSLLKSCILSFIKQRIKCKVFSLEVKQKVFIRSLLAEEFGIDSTRIKKGQVSFEQWAAMDKFRQDFIDPYLIIDDTPAININYFNRGAKKAVDWGAKFIGFDYVQLATVNKKDLPNQATREQEISYITNNLKKTSMELNVPTMALAQLGRKVEDRADKKPQVNDLREGGSLEQDADCIILIHRPEHYGIMKTKDGESLAGKAKLIIGKQRDGNIGVVKTNYRKETTSFTDDLGFNPYGTETVPIISADSDEPF